MLYVHLITLLDLGQIITFAPISLVALIVTLYLAGHLKAKRHVKTNYTRKLFHFTTFTFAAVLGHLGGYPAVLVFGGCAALFISAIIAAGDGNIFYEGIAREQDAPHRSFYIILPFISTAVAGLLGNHFFGDFAIVGYLVAGWGDAVGEPIGVRFGRHKYKVPTLTGIKCQRSIEGSLAILIVSACGAIFALAYVLHVPLTLALLAGALAGICACVVEAFSPHGVDNLTTQMVAVMVSFYGFELAKSLNILVGF